MTADLDIQTHGHSVTFRAKIVPGSSKTALAGTWDRMLKLKVAAPPEKGKANACIVTFLAKLLGVRKNDIRIVSGQTNPVKQIEIQGVSRETLLATLAQE